MQSPRYELQDPAAGRYRVVVHRSVSSPEGRRYYCEHHRGDLPLYRTTVTDSVTGRIIPAEIVGSEGARACGVRGPEQASWLLIELPRVLARDEWLPLILQIEIEDPEVLHERRDTLAFTPWASFSGDLVILPEGYSLVPAPNVRGVDTLPDDRIAVRIWQVAAVPTRLDVRAVRR